MRPRSPTSVIYAHPRTMVRSTKQEKSRGPYSQDPGIRSGGAKSFLPVQLSSYGPVGELFVVDIYVVAAGMLSELLA